MNPPALGLENKLTQPTMAWYEALQTTTMPSGWAG
jgi:hypothetical protein